MAAKKKAAKRGSRQIEAFVGSDEARLKEAALRRFREVVPPGGEEFGAEVIDGGAENAEAAVRAIAQTIEALQTLPFFGGEKVVWMKGATVFADSQTGKAQSVLDAAEGLGEVIEAGLGEGVRFIISASAIDKRRSFYKKLKKLGSVEEFNRPDMGREGWQDKVMPYARGLVRERGLDFDTDAMELFVMLAGDDAAQMASEVEKLDLFLGKGERTVTIDIVRRQVALTRAGVVFELSNCIARRDLAGALETVDHLIYQGENPVGILLAAVVPTVRRFLVAKELSGRRGVNASSYNNFSASLARLPASEIAHLPRKKDGGLSVYPVFLAMSEARRFSSAELRAGLASCLEANRALVTSQLDPRVVLERLLVRLLTRAAA